MKLKLKFTWKQLIESNILLLFSDVAYYRSYTRIMDVLEGLLGGGNASSLDLALLPLLLTAFPKGVINQKRFWETDVKTKPLSSLC